MSAIETIEILRAKGLTEDEIEEEIQWARDNFRETPPDGEREA